MRLAISTVWRAKISFDAEDFNRHNVSFHLIDVADVFLPDTFHVVFFIVALHWEHAHKAIRTNLKGNLHQGVKQEDFAMNFPSLGVSSSVFQPLRVHVAKREVIQK